MMNNEIKEIIELFRSTNENIMFCDIVELNSKQSHLLLDYITNLQQKYDKALEILEEYGTPCERDNFNLLDTDYCELNCSNDDEQFKKCWNKFIEWRLRDEQ